MRKPCLHCTRVVCPEACDNKECMPWREWFVDSWDRLRREPRLLREAHLETDGVVIGGERYALPHRVHGYLDNDPCEKCLCPRDLCRIPCRIERNWLQVKELLQ